MARAIDNCAILALFAISFCLFSTALSLEEREKLYVTLPQNYKSLNNFVLGTTAESNEADNSYVNKQFGVPPQVWEKLKASDEFKDYEIVETSLPQMPIDGLLNLVKMYPVIFSQVMPHLLEKAPVEKIAATIPSIVFSTLTDEDKSKLLPEPLQKLAEEYLKKSPL